MTIPEINTSTIHEKEDCDGMEFVRQEYDIIRNSHYRNCVFRKCTFKTIFQSWFMNCKFIDCKFIGVIQNAEFRDTTKFYKTKFDNADLHHSKIIGCEFKRCDISSASFRNGTYFYKTKI